MLLVNHDRRISMNTLPLDVCDQILMALSDFPTLRSIILCNRRFYEAYSNRRDSIMEIVMDRELGPALCFARALYLASTDDSCAITDDCFVKPEVHLVNPIRPREARELSRYCDTAKGFEEFFSVM